MLCAGEGGAIAGGFGDIEHARQWIDPETALPLADAVPNAKLSDIACALGRSQLAKLPFFLERRAAIASYYDQVLGKSADRVLRAKDGDTGTWWRYLIAVGPDDPERVVERALAEGVGFARPVPRRWWAACGRFPVSDRMHSTLVSVPIYPSLTDAEVERIADALHQHLTP
jgi:perosamine synthetase